LLDDDDDDDNDVAPNENPTALLDDDDDDDDDDEGAELTADVDPNVNPPPSLDTFDIGATPKVIPDEDLFDNTFICCVDFSPVSVAGACGAFFSQHEQSSISHGFETKQTSHCHDLPFVPPVSFEGFTDHFTSPQDDSTVFF